MTKKLTPSELPIPVFVMSEPTYVDNSVKNNVWIEEDYQPIDKVKFTSQWLDLYNFVAGNALVYLIPPKDGLQDQTYVNSGVYLPHLEEPTIVLSNFRGEGRAGEEFELGGLMHKLGYHVCRLPEEIKFEGEPELKYLKDNVYLGGYGQRSDKEAHEYIEKEWGAKIIKINEPDPYLYHLDCQVFVVDSENIIAYTKNWSKKTIKEVEKYVNIHSVSEDAAYMGICNSLSLNGMILNGSSLQFMKKTDKYYFDEVKKNKELEEIANKLGYEIVYFDIGEAWKSGALLSCFFMHLNHRDVVS